MSNDAKKDEIVFRLAEQWRHENAPHLSVPPRHIVDVLRQALTDYEALRETQPEHSA